MTTTIAISPFVTLHALQQFPPSLLNRDDTGATKQILLGGTTRVRVSPQAQRRAIREAMREHRLAGQEYALRTTRFPALTVDVLTAEYQRPDYIAAAKVSAIFRALGLKTNDKGNTAVQIFASEDLPARLAAIIDDAWDDITDTGEAAGTEAPATATEAATAGEGGTKKLPTALIAAAAATLDPGHALDLALFGRMLAERPNGEIDGAAGIAHATSVDPAAIEPDYWTAVDDAAADTEPAAANLGTTMVSAPVLYRTGFLDRHQLRETFAATSRADELADEAERAFIEWFIRAVPSAKKRSSVPNTLPSIVVATLGPQVLSAAPAFTNAITGTAVTETATTRMLATLDRYTDCIGAGASVVLVNDPTLDAIVAGRPGVTTTIADFIEQVAAL